MGEREDSGSVLDPTEMDSGEGGFGYPTNLLGGIGSLLEWIFSPPLLRLEIDSLFM
jgi:hypothetical protein